MKLLVYGLLVVTFLKASMEWVSRRKADTSWSALLFRRSEYFLYVLRYLNEKLKIKIFLNFHTFTTMKNFKYMYHEKNSKYYII